MRIRVRHGGPALAAALLVLAGPAAPAGALTPLPSLQSGCDRLDDRVIGADRTLLRWQRLSVSPHLPSSVRRQRLRMVATYLERRNHFEPVRLERCAEAGTPVTPVAVVDLAAFKARIRVCLRSGVRQRQLASRVGSMRRNDAPRMRLRAAIAGLRAAREHRDAACDRDLSVGR